MRARRIPLALLATVLMACTAVAQDLPAPTAPEEDPWALADPEDAPGLGPAFEHRGPMGPGGFGHRGPGPGRHPGGPGGFLGMLDGPAASAVGLTDSQRDKLRELRARHARQAIETRAKLQIARLDVHELMRKERPDRAAIEARIDEAARLGAELRKAQVGVMLEARSVLTPEQRKKLEQGSKLERQKTLEPKRGGRGARPRRI